MRMLGKVMLVIATLAIIGVVSYDVLKSAEPTETAGPIPAISNFAYPTGNFTLNLPEGWSAATLAEVRPPQGMGDVRLALRNASGTCTIAYTRIPRTALGIPPLSQVSFSDRIFTSDREQTDSSWWVLKSRAPAGLAFSGETRSPLPGEMRIVSIPTDFDQSTSTVRAFILYNENGGTVSDACNTDMNSILASFHWSYQATDLTSTSTGMLSLRNIAGASIQLLFMGADGIARVVEPIANNDSGSSAAVYDNKIYTTHNGQLIANDPFTKSESPIAAVSVASGDTIIDFLIVDDRVYYITTGNTGCLDKNGCNDVLYDAPLSGGTATKRIASIWAGRIVGFDRKEQSLYLESGYGDAGCFSAQYTRYSYLTHSTSSAAQVGGCSGEPGYEAASATVRAFDARFKSEVIPVSTLHIERGTLTPGDTSGDVPGTISLRFIYR